MDKFKNLKDSLREGDMFKSENGNIGIKLYGKFYFQFECNTSHLPYHGSWICDQATWNRKGSLYQGSEFF